MTIRLPGSFRTWLMAVCLFGFGWVLGVGFAREFWSEKTAAWVQAFGSIAAIIGAFGVAHFQAERAEQRSTSLARRSAFALAKAFDGHVTRGVTTLDQLPTGDDIAIVEPQFTKNAMEAFPIHTVNDPVAMVAFLEIMALEKARFEHVRSIWELRAGVPQSDRRTDAGEREAIRLIEIQISDHMATLRASVEE